MARRGVYIAATAAGYIDRRHSFFSVSTRGRGTLHWEKETRNGELPPGGEDGRVFFLFFPTLFKIAASYISLSLSLSLPFSLL
jgi:hypothetical protein